MKAIITNMFKVCKHHRLSAMLCLFILCSFISITNTYATHVVASDIEYKCTNTPGVWEVTMTVYRDCGPSNNNANICGASCGVCTQAIQISCNGVSYGSATLNLVSSKSISPDPLCTSIKNTCDNGGCIPAALRGPYTPAIEKFVFRGNVDLRTIPISCCEVRLSYTHCCRNSVISNGAANANFYSEAILNRCVSTTPCNNSPTILNDPYAVLCNGDPYVFNNGAFDIDGDSLSYRFAPSLTGPGASVNYTPPYSADRPMPFTGSNPNLPFPAGIRCDTINGDIMFTPAGFSPVPFIGTMSVEITQWRWNDVTLSYEKAGVTRRDLQMFIENCVPNNIPTFKTEPAAGGLAAQYNWNVCAGDQICFTVIGKDTDFNPPSISDTTYLSWNRALAGYGATFRPDYDSTQRDKQGPREDRYRFCWQTQEIHGRNLPYYFTIRAQDDRCPISGSSTRAFSVRVWEKAKVNIKKINHSCGNWQLEYERTKVPVNPPQNFTSVVWKVARQPNDFSFSGGFNTYVGNNTVNQTPIMYFRDGGRYKVELEITTPGPGGTLCTKIAYDTLDVDTPVRPIVRDTFLCRGNTITISAQGRFGTAPYVNYTWYNSVKDTNPGQAIWGPSSSSGFPLSPVPSEGRWYTVRVRDSKLCSGWDSVFVAVKELPVGVLPDSMRICFGDTFTMNAGDNNGNIRSYQWSTSAADTFQTLMRGDSNMFTVVITDTLGCQQTDTTYLFVNSRIFPNAGSDTTICMRDTATLRASGGQLYQWRNITTNANITGKGYDPTVRVAPINTSQPTTYVVSVYQSYPDTANRHVECVATDTVTVSVRPLPVLIRPILPTQVCFNTKTVTIGPYNTNQIGVDPVYRWSYPAAQGAVATPANITTQINIDSLKNIPAGDSTLTTPFINYIHYAYTAPQSFGGCTNTDSMPVYVYAVPKVNAGTTLLRCDNAGIYDITANLTSRSVTPVLSTAISTTYTFNWVGNGIDSIIVPNVSKRYTFNPNKAGVVYSPAPNIITYRYSLTSNYLATNPMTCANSDTVQFFVIPTPTIDAGSQIRICKNEPLLNLTTQAGATVIPQTGRGFWTGVGTDSVVVTNAISSGINFNAGAQGITSRTYLLAYKDTSTGCTVRDTSSIMIAPVPDARVSFQYAIVDKDSVFCRNTGDYYLYTFDGNSLVVGNTNTSDTGYSYLGTTAWSGISSATGNMPNARFNTNDPSLTANKTTGNKLIFKYTRQTNGIYCSGYDSVTAYIQDPPELTVTAGAAMCDYDNETQVSVAHIGPAAEGYNMTWTSSSGVFTAPNSLTTDFIPDNAARLAGQATVYARTNARGVCAVTEDSTIIIINRQPVAAIACDSCEGCEPLHPQMTALPTGISDPLYSWHWQGGTYPDSHDSTLTASLLYTGNGREAVVLTVSSASTGCQAVSTEQPIRVHAIPVAAFTPDPPYTTIAKPYFNFTNQSYTVDNSQMSYLWNMGALPPSKNDRLLTTTNPQNVEFGADTGWIPVKLYVTTAYGCMDSVINNVRVEPDITVFVPNAFYPGSSVPCDDGDPQCNRVFKVSANGYATIEIFVFNRWGQQVFYTTDATIGWDGTVRNNGTDICPQEVYIYQINATSFNAKQYKYSGSITLLR